METAGDPVDSRLPPQHCLRGTLRHSKVFVFWFLVQSHVCNKGENATFTGAFVRPSSDISSLSCEHCRHSHMVLLWNLCGSKGPCSDRFYHIKSCMFFVTFYFCSGDNYFRQKTCTINHDLRCLHKRSTLPLPPEIEIETEME